MDRTERFMKIDLLLQRRKATSLALMIEELEVSKATVKRDIEYMRDRMHAPIVWNKRLRWVGTLKSAVTYIELINTDILYSR